MKLVLILVAMGAWLHAQCVPVASGKIVARDLAGAIPLFERLDPETVIGFAPFPGVQRVLSSRELLSVAERHGLDPDGPMRSVCVERATHPLNPAELNLTLLAALGIADARLEVLDFSNQPLPQGRLDFPLAGLNKPPGDLPEGPVIWRGRLVYDGDRSLAVWAKVRIAVERPVLVAAEQISSGASIRAGQLKMLQVRMFPFSGPWLDSISEAVGKTARREIIAGQRIAPAALAQPQDVHRADQVRVRVVDGLATLSLDTVAESSGSKGETIMLRNPATGKIFRATVEDKGRAVMRSDGGVE
jgi:flagella basal body P-ring formation protein FlgA